MCQKGEMGLAAQDVTQRQVGVRSAMRQKVEGALIARRHGGQDGAFDRADVDVGDTAGEAVRTKGDK